MRCPVCQQLLDDETDCPCGYTVEEDQVPPLVVRDGKKDARRERAMRLRLREGKRCTL